MAVGDWNYVATIGGVSARPILESGGRLRPELTPDEAIDLIWSLSGPENSIELVFEHGWTPDRYEIWRRRAR
jgi:hypothetical protein